MVVTLRSKPIYAIAVPCACVCLYKPQYRHCQSLKPAHPRPLGDSFAFVCRKSINLLKMNTNNKTSTVNPLFNIQLNDVLHGHSSSYSIEAFLGQGTFGKVARCRNLKTKEHVAVKVLRNDYSESGRIEAKALEKVRQLDPDRSNLLKFTEHFTYNNNFCVVLEMLDISLFDFMRNRNFFPLHISEIRPIAQQILVALKALKSINLVHADIKPDNIMFVNHHSQPYKVKLIDFGLANEAPNLWKKGIVQNLSYRAPEVLLHHPTLDEGVDMWTLGCVLAFLFLGNHLYPMESEYEAMRIMLQLNGKPDNDFLDEAFNTDCYFNLVQKDPRRIWWLKSQDQYSLQVGKTIERYRGISSKLYSLDDLMAMHPGRRIPADSEDMGAFISLLKQMFAINPKKRIIPSEALRHDFITMAHLPLANNGPYIVSAKHLMKVCEPDQRNWISVKHEEEKTRTSRDDSSSHHKRAAAASLKNKTVNDVTGSVAVQQKEENIRASRNKKHEASLRKEAVISAPKTFKKEPVDTSKPLTDKNGLHADSSNKGQATCARKTNVKPDNFKILVIKGGSKETCSGEGDATVIKVRQDSSQSCVVKNGSNEASSSKGDTRSDPRTVVEFKQDNSKRLVVKNGSNDTSFSKGDEPSDPRARRKHKQDKSKRIAVKNKTNKASCNDGNKTSDPRSVTECKKDISKRLVVKNGFNEASCNNGQATSAPKTVKQDQLDTFKQSRKSRKKKSKKGSCEGISCEEKMTPAVRTVTKDQQDEPATQLTEKFTGEVKLKKKHFKRNCKFFSKTLKPLQAEETKMKEDSQLIQHHTPKR